MLDIETIAKGVQESIRDYPVKKIELFGSYAENRQTEGAMSIYSLNSLRLPCRCS